MMFAVPQAIDEYELVDPIDILTPLEKSGFWDGVVSLSLSLSIYQIRISVDVLYRDFNI